MRRTGPILIAVIGVLALLVDFFPGLTLPEIGPAGGTRVVETKLGLDLRGGLKVEYRVDPAGGKAPTLADTDVVKQIIERRVNATGVSEPVVVTSGTDRIVVEVPGVSDTAAIRKLVGATGQLAFVPIPSGETPPSQGQKMDLSQAKYAPLFTGTELASANIGSDKNGQRAVDFVLKDNGKNLFAQWTASHIGEYFAIVLDHKVISAPTIDSAPAPPPRRAGIRRPPGARSDRCNP